MYLVTHWESVQVAVLLPIQVLTFQNGPEEIGWPGAGVMNQIIPEMRIMLTFGTTARGNTGMISAEQIEPMVDSIWY